MNIYVQDGQKYIYLTQDELKELEWEPHRLLELFKDDSKTRGVSIPLAPGWLIGPSNVAAAKFRYGKDNVEESGGL